MSCSRFLIRKFSFCIAVLSFFFCGAGSLSAQSHWKEMLRGLLERHYYDTAIDFVNYAGNLPDCPMELKEQIDYRIGTIHLDALIRGEAPLGFEQHCEQARESFLRFLKEYPQHEEAFHANYNLGILFLEQGRRIRERCDALEDSPAQIQELRLAAREKLRESDLYFNAAERIAYEIAKQLRDDPRGNEDPQKLEKRRTVYGQYLDSRIRIAVVHFETAYTYDPSSDDFVRIMFDSYKKFHELTLKYKNYTGSLESKLWEAKSLFALNEMDSARTILSELVILPDIPQFQPILLESLQIILEINLSNPTEQKLRDSMERIDRWSNSLSETDRMSPHYAPLNLWAGKTCMRYADFCSEPEKQLAKNQAFEFFNSVNSGAPQSREAAQWIRGLGRKTSPGSSDTMELSQWKREAELQYQEYLRITRSLGESAREKDSFERQRMQSLQKTSAREALALYRIILEQQDSSWNPEERNSLHLKMSTLFWTLEKWEEILVIGEYLMDKYPAGSFGTRGAEFAIKSARRIFLEERGNQRNTDWIFDRIVRISDRILARWESHPIGQESLLIRMETELDRGSLEEAKRFINDIPENSSRRIAAEQQLGIALWNLYTRENSQLREEKPEIGPLSLTPEQLLEQARLHLEKALSSKERESHSATAPDFSTASCCTTLAQIYLMRSDPKKAVDILENPNFGPLKTLDSGDWPLSLKTHILTIALRAQVESGELDGAEEILARLESVSSARESGPPENSVPGQENGEELSGLLRTYLLLGRQFENRIQSLLKSGTPDEVDNALVSFERFLEQILQKGRRSGAEDSSFLWVADTYQRLGSTISGDPDSFSTDFPEDSPRKVKSLEFFSKSGEIYRGILQHDPRDSAIRYRLALVLRAQQQYEPSREIFTELLQEAENRLDVQLEAARTLQMSGKIDRNNYYKAIVGDRKTSDGKNLIWGWNEIIRKVANREQHEQIYYEAYYNKVLSRILLARTLGGDSRERELRGAENNIRQLQQLHPSLGGPDWSRKFHELLEELKK